MKKNLPYAAFGVVATLVGVGAGHLVASLLKPASSPVLAVGSQVIDLTPVAMKEWAIRNFGTADKPILIGSVFAGVLVFAAIAGVVTRRSLAAGATMLVVLVAIAAGAVLNRPAADPSDVLPSIATALAAVAALLLLVRTERATRPGAGLSNGAPHLRVGAGVTGTPALAPSGPDTVSDQDAPAGRTPSDTPAGATAEPATTGAKRRTLLVTAGLLTAAAAVMGGAGRLIAAYRIRPEDVTLPAATNPLAPLPAGLDAQVPGITPFVMPNPDFYRVDTRLDLPVIDLDSWSLTIEGDVGKKVTLSFDDILAMDMVEKDITLTCVSNSVGGPYVGGARWLGVPLADLIELVGGVGDGADQLFCTDVDGMTISTPLELATDGRDAMLAVGMNGEALPLEHGFPARMVIPGLYGFISATKWITNMKFTRYGDDTSYWEDRDWSTNAPIKISSRIDTPKSFETTQPGDTFIGGVAWAQQNGGVAKVQVQIDGGQWTDAMLGPSGGNDYWRQWYLPWKAESGAHRIGCRVVDGNGQTQTDVRTEPFPEGSSGIQTLIINVA